MHYDAHLFQLVAILVHVLLSEWAVRVKRGEESPIFQTLLLPSFLLPANINMELEQTSVLVQAPVVPRHFLDGSVQVVDSPLFLGVFSNRVIFVLNLNVDSVDVLILVLVGCNGRLLINFI